MTLVELNTAAFKLFDDLKRSIDKQAKAAERQAEALERIAAALELSVDFNVKFPKDKHDD